MSVSLPSPFDILDFWWRAGPSRWFARNDGFDKEIRTRFSDAVEASLNGDLDDWAASPHSALALILLLDQFPRNIFRDSGEAFAYDAKALAIAKKLIERGLDRFYLAEQTFVCLPLEHSEEIENQDRSVELFARMAVEAPDGWKDSKRLGLDFATRHRDLIRKFGRYPHRNEMLGRDSTDEEKAFIAEHGRGF